MSERYKAVEGSKSAHCCFEATVVDTQTPHPMFAGDHDWVCECYDMETAQKIADAMNAAERPAEQQPDVQGYVMVPAKEFESVLNRADWRTAKNRAELRNMLKARQSSAAPDVAGLTEALRQYQHNDGSGLVFGYDKLLVDQYVAQLVEAPQPVEHQPDASGLVEALELARRTLAMAALEGEVTRRIDSVLAALSEQGGGA